MSLSNVARLAALAVAFGTLVPPAVWAQHSDASVVSSSALRTLGLERVWHSQIQFDSSRGGLAGVTQYISPSSAQTIFEVTYQGGRITISDRDLDPFRKPLGREGAKNKAADWIATWKLRNKGRQEPKVTEHVVPDVVLVATSETGMVQCLNGETGRTFWTTKIGSVRHPTTAAAINDNFVAVINGTTLYMLDREDGHVIWERRTTHPAGAGPALTDNLVLIPMVNGHVEIFYVDEPRRPAALFHASGRCLVQPVVFRDAVAWPTDKGNLYVANADTPGIRFRITVDAIRSAPTFRAATPTTPMLVFFASLDGYVYAAETLKGNIVNRFSTGEAISETPVVVNDSVYVITDSGTLFCAGAEDGEERWFLPNVKRFLAANPERLYVLDRNKRLLGIDAQTGNLLGAAGLGNVDYTFLNTQSDRIYIGTTTGVLQCLREERRPFPLVHSGAEPARQAAETAPEPVESEAMPDETKPAEDNPFGEDAPAADKPMPKPAEDENPFD